MFDKTFKLGRPLGVELRLHWSLLALLLVVLPLSLLSGGLGGLVGAGTVIATLIASVTLHELGHIVAARQFGNETSGITLYPIGGIATLARSSRTPTEEMVVALAGPAVNVLLAGVAGIALSLLGPFALASTVLSVNGALALFNLIPAYPMDGGRVLRGALWKRLGQLDATWWAARAGQGFALLFGVAGLFGNPLLLVIAAFVFLQASAELARVRLIRLAHGARQDAASGDAAWEQLRGLWGRGDRREGPSWDPYRGARPRSGEWVQVRERQPRFSRVEFVVLPGGRVVPRDASPW